jgi:RNA polymerase sigma-70 factor, ECF subfamily
MILLDRMNAQDSFTLLISRLRAGDDTAARAVFLRFAERLIGVAHHHIAARLQHKIDPEDVVQSVFKSFFLRQQADPLEVRDWDSMWGLLALITVRKCIKRVEYEQAGRRDARRETPLAADVGNSALEWPLTDREPSPEEGVILAELVEELLSSFDADDRAVIELSLQGYGTLEVSERLGRAERTVRRLREKARTRLQARLDGDSG